MYRQKDAWLWGIKFTDANNNTLLATGLIDRPIFQKEQDEWPVQIVDLEEGERVLGVKVQKVDYNKGCFWGV